MNILPVLLTLAAVSAHQYRFLSILMPLWIAIPGRVNAQNFSRYSGWNERTFRRHFQAALPWHGLHLTLVKLLVGSGSDPTLHLGHGRELRCQIRPQNLRSWNLLE